MLHATLKSVWARKVRLALTAFAVVLGVAFVAGTFILTDTLRSGFDRLFGQITVNYDAVVRNRAAFGAGGGFDVQREPVPTAVLDSVRSTLGVKGASGFVSGFAQFVDKAGKSIGGNGPPTLLQSVAETPALEAFTVRTGRLPTGAGEVAMDANTARTNNFAVGDEVTVLTALAPERFRLVGIVGVGDLDSLAGSTQAVFDLATAQRLAEKVGVVDEIGVAGDPELSEADLVSGLRASLGQDLEILTGRQYAQQSSNEVATELAIFRTALLVFAGVALFVGAFLIFNTFTIVVAQRTRELGLLRALGAGRGQVLRSVLIEALIVGLVAAIVGLALGTAFAIGLKGLLSGFGIDLPAGGLVVTPRTIVVGFVIGVGVTVVAAIGPARRATRVPPLAALQEGLVSVTATPVRRRAIVGGVLSVVAVATLGFALFGDPPGQTGQRLSLIGLGLALLFIAVAVLSPLFVRPLARAIGWPISRLRRFPGRLARDNAERAPRRTASTAAALVVGLGLVGVVAVFSSSLKASFVKIIGETLASDYLVQSRVQQGPPDSTVFSPEVARELDALAEVGAVVAVRFGRVQIDGGDSFISAVGGDLDELMKLKTISGSVNDLESGGVAFSKQVADDKGAKVGDLVNVNFAKTGVKELPLRAVYSEARLVGGVLLSLQTYEENFTKNLDTIVLVDLAPGVDPVAGRAALQRVIDRYPSTKLESQIEARQSNEQQLNQIVGLVYALLGLALMIALFGIVNTLALSVVERYREIGLLRAVGMTRRQIRSTVRWESVIVAVLGTVIGLAVGVLCGWAFVAASGEGGITELVIPFGPLVSFVVVAALAGMLAAILPARRAARLDVLRVLEAV